MITKIAVKRMLNKKARVAITIVSVGFVITLFVCFRVLASAMIESSLSHLSSTDYDLITRAKGSSHGFGSLPLEPSLLRRIRRVSGVAIAEPIFETKGLIKYRGQEVPVVISSLRTNGINKPSKLKRGFIPAWRRGPGVVIDESLIVSLKGINVGDEVIIANSRFEVTGISEDHMLYYPVVYIPHELLDLSTGGMITQVLVKANGVSPQRLAERLRTEVGNIGVKTKSQLLRESRKELSFMNSVIYVLQLLILAVAILVLSITMYSSVLDQLRSIGIIKTLGASNRFICSFVMVDALIMTLFSAVIGLIGYKTIILVARNFLFTTSIGFSVSFFVELIVIVLIISFVSSLLALRKVLRIDPVLVAKAT